MRHVAWLAGCVLVVSCTVNSSNLNVDAASTGAGGHVIGTGGTTASGGAGGTVSTGGAGGDPCPRCVPTGGTTGTGGQIATGGTIGTGGQIATGGTTGTGGQAGAAGHAGTGGQIATGGTIGTGGQIATGGTTGTGGQIATGGTTGAGGQAGAAGHAGTGGQAGAGGAPGQTCSQLETDYASALMAAKSCTPGAPNQCKLTASTTIACPGCVVYVNDTTQLDALKAQWTNEGCAQSHAICPAIACIAPAPATCMENNSGPGSGGGTCSAN